MNIPMRIRKRDIETGRWPALTSLSPGKAVGPKPPKRHTVKAGGLGRRSRRNTRRGMPQARAIRGGGKGRVESRTHGGAYGTTAQAYPQAR